MFHSINTKIAERNPFILGDSLMDAVSLFYYTVVFATDTVIDVGLAVEVIPPTATKVLFYLLCQFAGFLLSDELGCLDAINDEA